jgi:predicted small lipoprotein YifL
MKLNETLAATLLAGALLITLSACTERGPLEEVGDEIEDAVEDAGDAIEDAID